MGHLLEDTKFSRKMNIALIATYPKMSKIFMRIADHPQLGIYNVFASFEQAVKVAKEMEYKIDAILSRGGTAAYIKEAVDIPVIFIPITPFDLVQVVHGLDPSVKEVAFFHYNQNIFGLREIETMYDIRIHEYTFLDRDDIFRGVRDAYDKGIRTIIGGEVAVSCAKELEMDGHEVGAGEDAVNRAFHETIQILYEKEKEKNKTVQLKAAFDSILEGVIVTDENNNVVVFNTAAEKVFGRKHIVGQQVSADICDDKFNEVFEKKIPQIEDLRKLNDTLYAINQKPIFLRDRFIGIVSTYEDITKVQELEKKIRHEIYTKGFLAKNVFSDIITENAKMHDQITLAKLYAKTTSTILIEGESGTGKEIFAQSIHNESTYKDGPFVAINCAAIPENLLESELFGYEAGAFTGARKDGKQGLFELAHNGTIFLDEIGEIPKVLQTRLLRVIQEKEVMRVGGNKIIPVNVRILSATNKNLKKMVEAGEFREDLFYRLNVFHLKVPPLRNRGGDVAVLSDIFMKRMKLSFEPKVHAMILEIMQEYHWPGNIRELMNVVERASILNALDRKISFTKELLKELLGLDIPKAHSGEAMQIDVYLAENLKDTLTAVERDIVNALLEEYDNNQDLVAERLGIGRTTLWRKSK